jgi:hypothetical protein
MSGNSRYFAENLTILMKSYYLVILILSIFLFIAVDLCGQQWEFIKEKDGIKIYTRKEQNSSIKSFKGEALLHRKYENIINLVGNPKNQDWWADDIKGLRILLYEKDKHVQYYLVYDVPWPIADRDLVVDAQISTNPETGVRIVEAKAISDVIPEKQGLVRIKKYWQKWTITPIKPDLVQVVLEGSADPGGSIPAWLSNMVITDTPLKVINNVKTHAVDK